MKLLVRLVDQGRNVSHSRTASNGAPAVMAGEPECIGKVNKRRLSFAMQRLFAAKKVKISNMAARLDPTNDSCPMSVQLVQLQKCQEMRSTNDRAPCVFPSVSAVPRVPYVFPACPCSPLYPLRGSTLPSLAWAREGEHGLR